MSYLIQGTNITLHHAEPMRILSVHAQNENAALQHLYIVNYQDVNGKHVIELHAAQNDVVSLHFSGVEFSSGASFVPTSNLDFFMIEYEPILPIASYFP